MSFEQDKIKQIALYKDEFIAILENDIDSLIKKHGLEPVEGEEPSSYDYINDVILGYMEPVSGFMLNNDYESQLFDDNVSYVRFHRAVGGPNVDFIVGSNGDAIFRYSYGGHHIDRISGNHEYSPLHEAAESIYAEKFTYNNFEMDDEELTLRQKQDLGVDSFEEWVNNNAQVIDCEVITFKELLHHLKETDYNLESAVIDSLEKGSFNLCDFEGVDFKPEDLIGDIKEHIRTLEKLSLNSDFEDVCSCFGINADDLTEIDFDNITDKLEQAFEPEEPEVKTKFKPKF